MTSDASCLHLASVRWWNAGAHYAVSVAAGLQAAGIPVRMLGRPRSPLIVEAAKRGISTEERLALERLNPAAMIANVVRLRSLLRENVSLINANRPEDHIFVALARRGLTDPPPFVRTVSDVRPPRDNRVNRWLHCPATDHFIFTCRASLERYQARWPVFEGRSTVIHAAVDCDTFRPRGADPALRQRLGIPREAVVIALLARWAPVKDHRTFCRAAARLIANRGEVRVLISGEADELSRADIEGEIGAAGIREATILLERSPEWPIQELLAMTDIGVVTSRGSEVVSRIAAEYMASGIPQVATRVNVLPEMIDDGASGLLVPAGDPEALAAALQRLVEDGELRGAMGAAARKAALHRFHPDRLTAETRAVYEALWESRLRR